MAHDQAADYRALREQVGLTQQDVAGALGVKVLSVKRWEDPDYQFKIPSYAWEPLDSAYELQKTVVEAAVDRACGDGMPVRLRYWRTKEDYEKHHQHNPGTFEQANATARAVAERLRAVGCTVSFSYAPTVPEEVWDEAQ